MFDQLRVSTQETPAASQDKLARVVHRAILEHAELLPAQIARAVLTAPGMRELAVGMCESQHFAELVASSIADGFGRSLGRLVSLSLGLVCESAGLSPDEVTDALGLGDDLSVSESRAETEVETPSGH